MQNHEFPIEFSPTAGLASFMHSFLIRNPSDPVGTLGLAGRDPTVDHLVGDLPLLHVIGVPDTVPDLHARASLD
eukprot:4549395-Heterocapsa_arctica.AAC.1